MFRLFIAAVATVTLVACEPVDPKGEGSGPAPASPSAPDLSAPDFDVGSTLVSPARAVSLFESVCGAALPNFGPALARARSNGFTNVNPETGTHFSVRENASFNVTRGETCSFVFASRAEPPQMLSAFEALGNFTPTPLGLTTLYRDRQALVTFRPVAARPDGNYYNVRLLVQ